MFTCAGSLSQDILIIAAGALCVGQLINTLGANWEVDSAIPESSSGSNPALLLILLSVCLLDLYKQLKNCDPDSDIRYPIMDSFKLY
jgi:hypothetical protein